MAAAIVALPAALPIFVPPVPLRLARATFGPEIDRETLELQGTLGRRIESTSMTGAMIVVVEVFAPGSVPTSVGLEWRRDGEPFREHGEVEIIAHEAGFRIWDGWRPEPGEAVGPGALHRDAEDVERTGLRRGRARRGVEARSRRTRPSGPRS